MNGRLVRILWPVAILLGVSGCGNDGDSGSSNALYQRNGNEYISKSIQSLSTEKAKFIISSLGQRVGELEIKNGWMLIYHNKYDNPYQGALTSYNSPDAECIGFDEPSIDARFGITKGERSFRMLCRAMESFTKNYRSHSSINPHPESVEKNQLFYITGAGVTGPKNLTYYNIRLGK